VHSTVSIDIAAPPGLVYLLVSEIERWPKLLPHYRSVRRVARRPDGSNLLQMIAVRPLVGILGFGLPVVWRASAWADPEALRLSFLHVGGVTAGMNVTWSIEPTASGCHVEIEHVFKRRLPIPVLGARFAEETLPAFVDRFFTRPIAERTLSTFRALAETLAQSTHDGDTSDPVRGTYPTT
jgi:ribosome-associated toxin RatA of RatAB toxin-antitoxin module